MSDFKKVIYDTCVRILEDWAMMLVEPTNTSISVFDAQRPMYVTSVCFKGALAGTYTILCQEEFMEALATSLLGSEADIAIDEKKDALREMANVLCGNLLTECYGDDCVFDLVIPSISEITSGEMAPLFSERTRCFMADSVPVAFTFNLENQ